jgi:predicted CoA-binding protein
MKKKTLVVGASPNPDRYGFKAVHKLHFWGHPVYAFGAKKGSVGEVSISDKWPNEHFDTVTLYLNPANQQEYYGRLLELKPKRVIFNPGTENPELELMLKQKGIEAERACTLVLLSLGQY